MAPRFSNSQLDKLLATSQGKSYTLVIVTVALVILISLGGVFPAISAIFFQIEENNARQEALQEVLKKDRIIKKLVEEEQKNQAISRSLAFYFPDDSGQDVVYEFIANSVTQSGVKLLAINFGELDDRRSLIRTFKVSETVQGKTLNLSLTGNRLQVESFLDALETARRIINIRSLSEFRVEGATLSEHRVEIQAEVFYLSTELEE